MHTWEEWFAAFLMTVGVGGFFCCSAAQPMRNFCCEAYQLGRTLPQKAPPSGECGLRPILNETDNGGQDRATSTTSDKL